MRPRLITAENPRAGWREAGIGRSFNEAAAHHRGEQAVGRGQRAVPGASMRPRLITAENRFEQRAGGRHGRASMRPRLITAENFQSFRSTAEIMPWLQ